VKFKLDESLPIMSTAVLTSVDHDVDGVSDEGLIGALDQTWSPQPPQRDDPDLPGPQIV
jgi:hypothetical protein